jgi:toxin CcdB
MARYDVFKNPGLHSQTTPFLINVQADLLESLDTCIVIPLRLHDAFASVRLPSDLVPIFSIDGVDCLLETPKMASVLRFPDQTGHSVHGKLITRSTPN